MAKSPRKAVLVSARDLSKVVDDAVKVALQRLGSAEQPKPVIAKGDLVGRVVKDVASAEIFASAVTDEVSRVGIDAEAAILIIDKKIVAGFFERGVVPQLRGL